MAWSDEALLPSDDTRILGIQEGEELPVFLQIPANLDMMGHSVRITDDDGLASSPIYNIVNLFRPVMRLMKS